MIKIRCNFDRLIRPTVSTCRLFWKRVVTVIPRRTDLNSNAPCDGLTGCAANEADIGAAAVTVGAAVAIGVTTAIGAMDIGAVGTVMAAGAAGAAADIADDQIKTHDVAVSASTRVSGLAPRQHYEGARSGVPFRRERWSDETVVLRQHSHSAPVFIVEFHRERVEIGFLTFPALSLGNHGHAVLFQ